VAGSWWRELARHDDNPFEPVPAPDLRAMGIDSSTPVADAGRILRERYPELPAEILNADGAQLRKIVIGGGSAAIVTSCVMNPNR
jgi:hypothetical protein